jgi:hypothetical protein
LVLSFASEGELLWTPDVCFMIDQNNPGSHFYSITLTDSLPYDLEIQRCTEQNSEKQEVLEMSQDHCCIWPGWTNETPLTMSWQLVRMNVRYIGIYYIIFSTFCMLKLSITESKNVNSIFIIVEVRVLERNKTN